MKNNFDLEKMQELWDRQSQSLQGRQLISDEEIADATSARRPWLPKAAAVAAFLLLGGGAALWLGNTPQELPASSPSAMLTTPRPIAQAETHPASSPKAVLKTHTRPLVAEKRIPAQVQEPAATNALSETELLTAQHLAVPERALSEDDKKAAPMPAVIETHRLVTIGATRPEAAPTIIESNNLVTRSEEEPAHLVPRFEMEAPKPLESERPSFHNCVIEPLLASII